MMTEKAGCWSACSVDSSFARSVMKPAGVNSNNPHLRKQSMTCSRPEPRSGHRGRRKCLLHGLPIIRVTRSAGTWDSNFRKSPVNYAC